jgi:tetratricopeptide (TPR) repeat protein
MAGIYVVNGMAGVGKTAFAVHAASEMAPLFPDGQLFVSLRAHTPGHQPADPADALASLLVTIGIDPGHIPAGLEERSSLWRGYSAGRRLLLLLDDAADSDQVKPLLPGSANSLILVTSRRRLTALLDTQNISLGTLPPDEAAELVRRLAARPGIEHDAASVDEIVRLSGALPLALALLAQQLRHHPSWTIADLAADLAAAHDRFELMNAENVSVAAAFNLSYQHLSDAQQRMFRRLGLHPGTMIDTYAAAALAGTDAGTARRQLEQLYEAGLLEEPARDSYRLHDLIREYARSLAATDEPADRQAAIGQLLGYYLQTAQAAGNELGRRLPTAGPADDSARPETGRPLSGRAVAQAWLEAELDNLQAAAALAAATARADYVIALSAAVHEFLRRRGYWMRALAMHQVAARTAPSVGPVEEARALTDLGEMEHLTDDYPAAAASLMRALALYRELGDRLGEAGALVGLGGVQQATGDYDAAAASLMRALALYRELGDRLGEADALLGMGMAQLPAGDYAAAAAYLAQALALYREFGDRLGEADALLGLGMAHLPAGDYAATGRYLAQALEQYRSLGRISGEAGALRAIGLSRIQGGQPPQGVGPLQSALALYRQIGSPEARQVELALAAHSI